MFWNNRVNDKGQTEGLVIFVGLLCAVLAGTVIPTAKEGEGKEIVEAIDFGKIVKVREKPKNGFYWPYYLYVSDSIRNSTEENELSYLLVLPNNTGRSDDSTKIHDDSAKRMAENLKRLADYLRVPLLVPTFPRLRRYWKIYTHQLDRDTLLTRKRKLKRVDLQLVAMIDDSIESLSSKGINLDKKVLMMGFSAAGSFVNRFVIIHPKRVQAAAIGSPGWPIAPVGEWNGIKLRYPIGVWDLERLVKKEFDLESFKSVPLYFFMGDEDTNDPVPYRDGYDPKDEKLIFENFGDNLVARWAVAEKIYESVGCSSQFVLYPGIGHIVSHKMIKDIERFFLNNL